MSSINPNNIDGTYPIAGQDNDSQGFRDNFTNIKNNFTFAYDELTDLQSKAVLKSALTGGSLNNDMNYNQLISAQLLKTVETVNNLGTKTGSFTISWADGHFQYYTTSGNTTLAFSNWPTSAYYTCLRLQITTDTANRTVTWPSGVKQTLGLNEIQNTASQVMTLPTAGVYLFELTTYDNGDNITIQDLLRNYEIINTGTSGDFLTVSAGTIIANTLANITASTVSTTNTSGALKVAGGVGIVGNLNVGSLTTPSGQYHNIIGNVSLTGVSGIYLNIAGNILGTAATFSSALVTGLMTTAGINSSANILATGGIFSYLTVNGNESVTGYLNVTGNVLAAQATVGAVAATGAITSSGTGGVGYAVGAGGTIAQGAGAEKNTTVVLNKTTGTITLNGGICFANARLANSFTLTNSTISNQDLIVIQHVNVGALGGYSFAANTATAGGSAQIHVRNLTQLDLSESIIIRFAVIKSSDS